MRWQARYRVPGKFGTGFDSNSRVAADCRSNGILRDFFHGNNHRKNIGIPSRQGYA